MLYLSFTLYLIHASHALAGRSGMINRERSSNRERNGEWGMGATRERR